MGYFPEYGAPELNEIASERPRSNILMGSSPRRRYILAQWKVLKGQAREKVEEKVQAICSEFPLFVKVMTKSSVTFRAVRDIQSLVSSEATCNFIVL